VSLFLDDASAIADPFLRRAFTLAESGRGTVSPNPLVGCVIVRDGVVVGEGHHQHAGGPHAEIAALDAAGDRAAGASVYCTLEPCNHYGRTPPCTSALLKAGVARVVIGLRDPNPEVTGAGAETLAAAGVEIAFAPDDAPFRFQNEAWLVRVRTGLPFVRVKVALTLDARPGLFASRRARITGSGGGAVTMLLRERATAVFVGAATLQVDDPQLTVRDADGRAAVRQPVRGVLSRTSVPSPSARMVCDGLGKSLLVTSDAADRSAVAALEALGVETRTYRYADGVRGALGALADAGIDDVLIEAGPAILTALWNARAIDELIVIHAGGMGGNAAPPLFLGGGEIAGGELTPSFRALEAAVRGDDAVTVWRPRPEAAGETRATGRSS
jgi:diaminohydroxyphosphoribosylaminopyrimidine deaminase/5-amino-6-(5-phosphoribosylamino)uracil reductase